MDRLKVSYGPKFVYLVCFTCPNCDSLLISREHGNSEGKTEHELRDRNYPVHCGKCDFKGILVGSEIIHFVELEWER
jgi:hypothetical protein